MRTRALVDIERMCDPLFDPPDPDPDLDMSPTDKAWAALQRVLYEIEQTVGMKALYEVLSEVTAAYDGNAHPAQWNAWDGYEQPEREWRCRAWELGVMAKGEDEKR